MLETESLLVFYTGLLELCIVFFTACLGVGSSLGSVVRVSVYSSYLPTAAICVESLCVHLQGLGDKGYKAGSSKKQYFSPQPWMAITEGQAVTWGCLWPCTASTGLGCRWLLLC